MKKKKKDRDSEAHDHALSWTNSSSTHSASQKRSHDHWFVHVCDDRACVHAATVSPLWMCKLFSRWIYVSVTLKKLTFLSVAHPGKASGKAVDAKRPWSSLKKKKGKKKKKQLSGQCSALKCEHRWDLFCKRSCSQCSSVSFWRSVAHSVFSCLKALLSICVFNKSAQPTILVLSNRVISKCEI